MNDSSSANPEKKFLDRLADRLKDRGYIEDSDSNTLAGESLGAFTILREIGRGGMGVVYLAEQKSPKRLVALKVLNPQFSSFAGPRERMHREANAIARLRHPNILPLYALEERDGVPLLAMEFVPGVPLSRLLHELADVAPADLSGRAVRHLLDEILKKEFGDLFESGAIPHQQLDIRTDFWEKPYPQICVAIAGQIAQALDYAHRSDIVHRDVKPSNILITRSGHAYLVDFGLASDGGMGSLTGTNEFLGTLGYAPPESLRGKAGRREHRGDIYSLGLVLYEMLTLHHPFRGETQQEILHAVATVSPPPIERFNESASVDLRRICKKAMEKDPAWRYYSAKELGDDLERFRQGEPVSVGAFALAARNAWRVKGIALSIVSAIALMGWIGLQTEFSTQKDGLDRPARETADSAKPLPKIAEEKKIPAGRFAAREHQFAYCLALFFRVEYDAAIRELEALLDADPSYHCAYPFLAYCYHVVNLPSGLSSALERATRARSDSEMLDLYRKFMMVTYPAGSQYLLMPRMPKAEITPLDPQSAHDPFEATIVFSQAMTLKNFPTAVRALDRALELDRKLVWPYLARGICLALFFYEQNRAEDALLDLRTYVRIDPDDPVGATALGFLYLKLKRIPEAEAQFQFALERDVRFGFALLGMAAIAHERGDDSLSEQYLGKIEKTDRGYAAVREVLRAQSSSRGNR